MGNLKNNIDVLTKATYITGKIIKKELVEGMTFDESLRRYEDLVFEHQLKVKINNMIFLNEPCYYYYQVSDSLINKIEDQKFLVSPIYDGRNMLKVKIESIITIKTIHIIYMIYVLDKNRRKENVRTSNRRSYVNSYE